MADVDMKDATIAKEAKAKSGPSGASGKPRFEVKKVCSLRTIDNFGYTVLTGK